MRSIKKRIWIAFVAFLGLSMALAGCATPAVDASAQFSATDVLCTQVSKNLKDAKTTLTDAKKELTATQGTPGEVDAQVAMDAATDKVEALEARKTECKSESTSTATPSPTPTTEACSWKMGTADHTNNRWFYEGIAEIKSAKTSADAIIAAGVWLDKIREVPSLLSGAAKVFLQRDVNKDTLTNTDGCASDVAVDLYSELALTLAGAKSIVPDTAPTDAGNSGIHNDTLVFSSGVTGDEASRKAVKVITADGREIWIIARCGNLATPGNPGVPEGPTDNVLYPKKIADEPYSRGNADTGGGVNNDPGPGTYTPPTKVTQPPSTPQVNPAPPAPEVPAPAPSKPATQPTTKPTPVPTKDPDPPTATPEPQAPEPANPTAPPPSTCVIPPGETSC